MLPRSSRLPTSEFLARGYKTQKTSYFSLKTKPNGLPRNRIGVIISVAAVKSAARRNFWKRQIKSLIANHESLVATHFDFLVIFFKKGDSLTRMAFRSELQKVCFLAMTPSNR
jgi:ribonuclease P protein component